MKDPICDSIGLSKFLCSHVKILQGQIAESWKKEQQVSHSHNTFDYQWKTSHVIDEIINTHPVKLEYPRRRKQYNSLIQQVRL